MKKNSNELWWLVSTGAAILLTALLVGHIQRKDEAAKKKRQQDSIRYERQQHSIWRSRMDTFLQDHSSLQQID